MKTAFLQHTVRQLLETILCFEKLIGEMALPEYGADQHQNTSDYWLTLSARPPFQNFSTTCILNVNNTGAKQGSIMK
jgi:hypothetical protein